MLYWIVRFCSNFILICIGLQKQFLTKTGTGSSESRMNVHFFIHRSLALTPYIMFLWVAGPLTPSDACITHPPGLADRIAANFTRDKSHHRIVSVHKRERGGAGGLDLFVSPAESYQLRAYLAAVDSLCTHDRMKVFPTPWNYMLLVMAIVGLLLSGGCLFKVCGVARHTVGGYLNGPNPSRRKDGDGDGHGHYQPVSV